MLHQKSVDLYRTGTADAAPMNFRALRASYSGPFLANNNCWIGPFDPSWETPTLFGGIYSVVACGEASVYKYWSGFFHSA
jgi:hypothetical protein